MYVLDTDVIIDFMKGKQDIVDTVRGLEEIFITVTSIAELSYGLHNSKQPRNKLADLVKLIGSIEIIGIGLPTSFKFGEIKAQLLSTGKPIDDFDVFIASSCLVHDCILVTRNKKHYQNIPGLKIHEF